MILKLYECRTHNELTESKESRLFHFIPIESTHNLFFCFIARRRNCKWIGIFGFNFSTAIENTKAHVTKSNNFEGVSCNLNNTSIVKQYFIIYGPQLTDYLAQAKTWKERTKKKKPPNADNNEEMNDKLRNEKQHTKQNEQKKNYKIPKSYTYCLINSIVCI